MYRTPVEVSIFVIIVGIVRSVTGTALMHAEGNNIDSWSPSPSFLQLYKEHLKWSSLGKQNKNLTATDDDEELTRQIEELLAWNPPAYIVKNFPYYLAGYSSEGNPVWIVEGGRFDINDLIRQGPEMVEAAETTAEQGLLRVLKSIDDAPASGDKLQRLEGIVDLDGMNINTFSDPEALALGLRIATRYFDVGLALLHSATLINSNYFVDSLVTIFRPALGQLMERIEIHGPNQRKALRRLRELLPSSSLPPWYGGDKGFKPLAAYG